MRSVHLFGLRPDETHGSVLERGYTEMQQNQEKI